MLHGNSPPIEIANLGMADSLILMVMALVVFGPRRLPQIGRQIGKLMYEFRKASNDFKFQMEEELRNAEEADRRKREEAERQQSVTEAQKAVELAQERCRDCVERRGGNQSRANYRRPMPPRQPSPRRQLRSPEPPRTAEPVAEDSEPTETGLRVQPPSTGEQVAANRRRPSQPARARAGSRSRGSASQAELLTNPSTTPEPTAHHG